MKQIIRLLALVGIIYSCGNGDDPDPEKELSVQFTSSPPTSVDHNRNYSYTIETTITDGDSVRYDVKAPSWIEFDEDLQNLTGIADWENLDRSFKIILKPRMELIPQFNLFL